MSNKLVPKIYRSIIDDVIANMRPAFDELGLSDEVLDELQHKWETKVIASRVAEFEPPPSLPLPSAHPHASASTHAYPGLPHYAAYTDGPSASESEEEEDGYAAPRSAHPSLPLPPPKKGEEEDKDDEAINSDLDDSDTENEEDPEDAGPETDIVFCTYDKASSELTASRKEACTAGILFLCELTASRKKAWAAGFLFLGRRKHTLLAGLRRAMRRRAYSSCCAAGIPSDVLTASRRARKEQVEVRAQGRDDPHQRQGLFVPAVYWVRLRSSSSNSLLGFLRVAIFLSLGEGEGGRGGRRFVDPAVLCSCVDGWWLGDCASPSPAWVRPFGRWVVGASVAVAVALPGSFTPLRRPLPARFRGSGLGPSHFLGGHCLPFPSSFGWARFRVAIAIAIALAWVGAPFAFTRHLPSRPIAVTAPCAFSWVGRASPGSGWLPDLRVVALWVVYPPCAVPLPAGAFPPGVVCAAAPFACCAWPCPYWGWVGPARVNGVRRGGGGGCIPRSSCLIPSPLDGFPAWVGIVYGVGPVCLPDTRVVSLTGAGSVARAEEKAEDVYSPRRLPEGMVLQKGILNNKYSSRRPEFHLESER
ncbi:hypothetical protein DFH09DRAFT_1287321 [Mycena vulgaris]|nr:hypothetical protein DFH09DRAFT_1287321 [Mycena vulgaris]